MRGVMLDIDGTTLLGGEALPGAQELVQTLRRAHVPLLWLTNNTSRSRAEWLRRLAEAGLAPRDEELYTAGDATIDHLRAMDPRPRVHLVGTRALAEDFRAAGLTLAAAEEAPDLVVLGYDTELTYAKLCDATHLLRRGLPFLATHPDPTCPTPDGPIPDVGAFLALFEVATGRRARVIGKPEAAMARGALGRLGCAASETVLVGDRLATDVRMANRAGLRSALVLTGVTSAEEAAAAGAADRPSAVYASLSEFLADVGRDLEGPARGGHVRP